MQIDNHRIKTSQSTNGNPCTDHLSVPAYFFYYRKKASLKNGTVLHVRPVRGFDVPGLSRFYNMLSEESVFCRFGLRRMYMSHDCLIRLCQVDFDRDFAFLAVVPGEEEYIIGEARLNRLSEFTSAELSFVIADQWQGKGVGNLLMDFCLTVAKEIGLTKVLMEVLKSNVRMIQFAYKYDFQRLYCNKEDDIETLELKIGPETKLSYLLWSCSYRKRQGSQLISGTRRDQVYH